jgi:hypothetical protein
MATERKRLFNFSNLNSQTAEPLFPSESAPRSGIFGRASQQKSMPDFNFEAQPSGLFTGLSGKERREQKKQEEKERLAAASQPSPELQAQIEANNQRLAEVQRQNVASLRARLRGGGRYLLANLEAQKTTLG